MALTKQISSRALILSPSTAEVTTAQTIAPYYTFNVAGVLNIPVIEHFDCGRYIHADQSFSAAKVSVRTGGTSEYDLQVKSYDVSGGDEVIHVDLTGLQFTDDNSLTTLVFLENEIQAERTLVMSLFESVAGTPVEDLSLTIVSSLFADIDSLDSLPVESLTGPSLSNTQVFTLDAKKALAITPSGVDYASADAPATAEACIGISIASSAPSSAINMVSAGLASNVITGLGFTAGDEIFLGISGDLVDSATAAAFPPGHSLKQLGFALNATDMWVQISDAEIII
jgi:hypothetical protein